MFLIWLVTMIGVAMGSTRAATTEQLIPCMGIPLLLGSFWMAWCLDKKHKVLTMAGLTFLCALLMLPSLLAVFFGFCSQMGLH